MIAWVMVKSRHWIDLTASSPMPCQLKITSMMKAPPKQIADLQSDDRDDGQAARLAARGGARRPIRGMPLARAARM